MSTNPSLLRKKWWHATLVIQDRENGEAIVTLTTIGRNESGLAIADANADSTIFAYASNSPNCSTPVPIPVPSYDFIASPGIFVFKPSVEVLGEAIININTYQDAINLNNRRIFEYTYYAAYDPSDAECQAATPQYLDNTPYQVVSNSLSSNVFRYPIISYYDRIGCCQVQLSESGLTIPVLEENEQKTRLWYLTYNETESAYYILSYDFALSSNQLVSRGKINMNEAPVGTSLYDITWLPDNTLVVLSSDGIRQLFPGNSSRQAKLGQIIPITNISDYASTNLTIKPCIEYNYYGNNLFIFGAIVDGGGNILPTIFKLSYSNSSFEITNTSIAYALPKNIGDFAFQDENTSLFINNGDLYELDLSQSSFGQSTAISTGQPLAGMQVVNFAADPDPLVSDNVLYATNSIGQIFRTDSITGVPSILSSALITPGTVLGCTTTLTGEETRILPFPFFTGVSPWLFMIDLSSSMGGSKIGRIITALNSFLRNYVRYGDKITVLWFRNTSGSITKELKTYADTIEIINYINTYFITSSNSSNFCSALANLNFTDLRNIVILSDGMFTDCGFSVAEWQSSLATGIGNLQSQNPNANFKIVGISPTDSSKLQFIADFSGGIYTKWNE